MQFEFAPLWHEFNREAALSSESISSGLEALKKGDFTNHGLYYFAFYNLSTGLERILKIMFILDYAINNSNLYPDDGILKNQIGHNLSKLFENCQNIQQKYGIKLDLSIDNNAIEYRIINLLSDFAMHTRYYNLNIILKNKKSAHDNNPLVVWHKDIGDLIRKSHLKQDILHKRKIKADFLSDVFEENSVVIHTGESGEAIHTYFDMSMKSDDSRFMQKYGTYYCARLCAYILEIFRNVNHSAHSSGLEVPVMYEHFFPFYPPRKDLINRKTFPPRARLYR